MPNLNLPIDIPWKLVNCSEDMMDKTFCDKKMPTPFRSSIALYTYEPKEEDIPEEYSKCGQKITYLKVSCSITGFQPTAIERQGIIDFLSSLGEVDYSKLEEIINEYFGCYGVLLNVSVHPEEKHEGDLKKYPHIIDFEPKIREFLQAASETGELLTTSNSNLKTGKSFTTTDSTKNSWKTNAKATLGDPKTQGGEVGVGGETGQERTETDQDNWSINTDATEFASRKESATTQLSQMYNILTGLHTGTNRASFIMLPRPHILQSTDRRTFTQGLRVIEGIQDFFLIVIRDKDQPILNVDAFLQTGHFPEYLEESTSNTVERENSFTFNIGPISLKAKRKSLLAFTWFEETSFSGTETVSNPQLNEGFQIDYGKPITEEKLSDDNENQFTSGVWDIDTKIRRAGQQVTVTYTLKTDWNSNFPIILHRKYTVPTKKTETISEGAGTNQLLITQRKLCTQISYGDCISAIDPTKIRIPGRDLVNVPGSGRFDGIVFEVPFDITPLFDIPVAFDRDIQEPKIKWPIPRSRNDFAFKKGIIRKIQNSMQSALNSPLKNDFGTIGYLQSKHFQKRLLQILPKDVLESSIQQLDFINPQIKEKASKSISLKEILTSNGLLMQHKFGIIKQDLILFPNLSKTKDSL